MTTDAGADGSAACWVISDGAAGNEKQALALARALGHQPARLRVELSAPWRWLAPSGPRDPRRVLAADQARQLSPPWPDLVIGCGRASALVALGVQRQSGGHSRLVQILDPRRHRDDFDVLVVPRHDGLAGTNVVTSVGALNDIDDRWLASGRSTFTHFYNLPQPRTAVLVGGPTRGFALDRGHVDDMLSLLDDWRDDDGSFLITCSRRTPPALVERLRHWSAGVPGVLWASDADGDNPYAGLLGWADRIVVTPDSSNLLSEACATGMPVLVPAPDRVKGKTATLLETLVDTGRVRPLTGRFEPWSYTPLRELPGVADAVRRHLRRTTTR